mmetsp:Transcript_27556/g.86919  ORF Transcript_27556/g.86919 Transcript_27556/m.86919 type:complete len:262 (+) Transcript_27556:219-1004(+)
MTRAWHRPCSPHRTGAGPWAYRRRKTGAVPWTTRTIGGVRQGCTGCPQERTLGHAWAAIRGGMQTRRHPDQRTSRQCLVPFRSGLRDPLMGKCIQARRRDGTRAWLRGPMIQLGIVGNRRSSGAARRACSPLRTARGDRCLPRATSGARGSLPPLGLQWARPAPRRGVQARLRRLPQASQELTSRPLRATAERTGMPERWTSRLTPLRALRIAPKHKARHRSHPGLPARRPGRRQQGTPQAPPLAGQPGRRRRRRTPCQRP